MQRRWKWATWGVVAAGAVGAYLYWLHDWRPSCRNVPSAGAASEWLNGLASGGNPFTPAYVACIELAVFWELENEKQDRQHYPHPGIGVHYTTPPPAEGYAKLKDLPRLRQVELRTFNLKRKPNPGYADAVAASIGQYARLVSFEMDLQNFNDSGVKDPFTDSGLRHLARIETLERLSVRHASLGDGIAALAALPRLSELRLQRSTISQAGVAGFARLAQVKDLSLSGAQLDADLSPIARMLALRHLELANAKVSDDQIATLTGAAALLNLGLQGVRIGPRGLAGIAGNPKLEGLSLAEAKIAGGLENLARAPSLYFLNLYEADLDDARAAGLANITGLKHLRLSKTAIGDATVAALATLPRLEKLELNETRVTDEGLRALAQAPQLVELYLVNTAVTDAGLDHIARIPRLKEVALGGSKVTAAGIAKLKAAKPDLKVHN